MLFAEWKEQPAVEAVFKGVRPAVVALIAAPLVKMARTATKDKGHNAIFLLVSLAAALLIWLGHVNPVWVILATIVITIIAVSIQQSAFINHNHKSSSRQSPHALPATVHIVL